MQCDIRQSWVADHPLTHLHSVSEWNPLSICSDRWSLLVDCPRCQLSELGDTLNFWRCWMDSFRRTTFCSNSFMRISNNTPLVCVLLKSGFALRYQHLFQSCDLDWSHLWDPFLLFRELYSTNHRSHLMTSALSVNCEFVQRTQKHSVASSEWLHLVDAKGTTVLVRCYGSTMSSSLLSES